MGRMLHRFRRGLTAFTSPSIVKSQNAGEGGRDKKIMQWEDKLFREDGHFCADITNVKRH